ncbi:MAG: 3-phosphoshikimate 1-carboxyvinyltransferase [Pseudomonadota bacterium]
MTASGTPVPMTSSAARRMNGTAQVPGDKSISHRALILGALAAGETRIEGLLQSDDVMATAGALRACSVPIAQTGDIWVVQGRGVGGLSQPEASLDFGNTGTGVRLMLGVLAGNDITVDLTGDASLSARPMGRVLNPLISMGASVEDTGMTLPLTLRGSPSLAPIHYPLPVASAQVKSAVLLAGLHARGSTTVVEDTPTRDHTERMLKHFGAPLDIERQDDGSVAITVTSGTELAAAPVSVPGDPSSAAFPVAAAVLAESGTVRVPGVMMNETRTGLYQTLIDMGAALEFADERDGGGETLADIVVTAGAPLRGVHVPAARVPSMVDEYPMLACIAACASGTTRMDGLAELRVKECDRLAATAAGLQAQGVAVEIEGDSLIVHGNGPGSVAGGGRVATHLDHRIAMAFLTLGSAAQAPITVDDTTMIATSFPNFTELLNGLGAKLTRSEAGI